jgi:hypothetical protein
MNEFRVNGNMTKTLHANSRSGNATPALPAAKAAMVHAAPERIVYPATRDLLMAVPTAGDKLDFNYWSLESDAQDWVAQGKHFSLHKRDRDYEGIRKPASATDFYNTDQSSKMSLSNRVTHSPLRYVNMRTQSAGRTGPYLGTLISTGVRVGPGAYSPHASTMPRQEPNLSVFASGSLARAPAGNRNMGEACYATLDADERARKHAHFLKQKGAPILQSMRWERPVGPGSNLPAAKINPGPGAYRTLHSWPSTGYMGTARGYNHNLG